MRTLLCRLLLAIMLPLAATGGCDSLQYLSRTEVPFGHLPSTRCGDAIVFNQIRIGRVAKIVEGGAAVRVVVDVRPGTLPPRAVLFATTDAEGNTCLEVYPLPSNAHAARGPYWGATSAAELAYFLGRERLDAGVTSARDWLLKTLSAPQPKK